MNRTFTLSGPDTEVTDGVRAVLDRHGEALARGESPSQLGTDFYWELDDEIFSVAAFEQDADQLVEVLEQVASRILGLIPSGPAWSGSIATNLASCRVIARPVVERIARLDDTKLRTLCESAWPMFRHSAGLAPSLDPDWTQSVRTFVIQARSATANGWKVFVFTPFQDPDHR